MRTPITIPIVATTWVLLACGGPTDPQPSPRLESAGWSFGLCAGPCHGELTLSGSELSYRITDRPGNQVFVTTSGRLTAAGGARLTGLVDALPAVLEARYGCPDCADGGAATVTVDAGAGSMTSTYEFFQPPSDLESLDTFLKGVMDALEKCTTTSDVTPDANCEPLRPG